MNKLRSFGLLSLLLLAACSSAVEKPADNGVPAMLNAELSAPEQAELNEEITISTAVSQAGEPVEDAEDIEYEIWKEGGKENSEMVPAVHEGNGVYTIRKAFTEKAVYTVQVHVIARNMHTMPETVVAVGGAELPASETESAEKSAHH